VTYVGDGEATTVIQRAGESPWIGLGPMTTRVVASAALTGGRYSLYEIHLGEEGGGAGPHFHRTFAESFHVVTGEIEFFDGHEWVAGAPGDHVVIPEGGVHGFRNVSGAAAEMLMMSTPAAPREAYFQELVEMVRDGIQLTPEEFAEFWARHDQYMV
jgi:mannose-6-phosphate isomerase-like protein (cupin superfamily)